MHRRKDRRSIFTNLTTDILRKILDFLKNEIKRKEEAEKEIKKTEENEDDIVIKEEQCLLLCLIITKSNFCKNIIALKT